MFTFAHKRRLGGGLGGTPLRCGLRPHPGPGAPVHCSQVCSLELVCVGPTEARTGQNPLKTGTRALLARNDTRKRPRASRDKSSALFARSLCWFALTLRRFVSLCLGLCSVCVGLCWFVFSLCWFMLALWQAGAAFYDKIDDSGARRTGLEMG